MPDRLKSCNRDGRIILIAKSKGGVGKSTVAVQVAAWLHEQGHRVTLADCDTQQSSSEWIREAEPEVRAVQLDNPDMILNDCMRLINNTSTNPTATPASHLASSPNLIARGWFTKRVSRGENF